MAVEFITGHNVLEEVDAILSNSYSQDSWSVEDIYKLEQYAYANRTGEEFITFSRPLQLHQPLGPPQPLPPGGGHDPHQT